MAARRLIAILLVMLFLSSLAAALAPVEQDGGGTSTDSASTPSTAELPAQPASPASKPQVIDRRIDASRATSPVIRAAPGDQLQLRITSQSSGTVEIAGIGPTEDVGPAQPAFFDVLLRDPGEYPVRFLETRREIARISVSPAPAGGQSR